MDECNIEDKINSLVKKTKAKIQDFWSSSLDKIQGDLHPSIAQTMGMSIKRSRNPTQIQISKELAMSTRSLDRDNLNSHGEVGWQ